MLGQNVRIIQCPRFSKFHFSELGTIKLAPLILIVKYPFRVRKISERERERERKSNDRLKQ